MRITLDLPPEIWGRLASLADEQGVKIADVIRAGVRAVLPVQRSALDEMRTMIHAGIPDPVVAHRAGFSIEMVRQERRAMKIRAPKFDRRDWPELLRPRGHEEIAA